MRHLSALAVGLAWFMVLSLPMLAAAQEPWAPDSYLPPLTSVSDKDYDKIAVGRWETILRMLCQPNNREVFLKEFENQSGLRRRLAGLMLYMMGEDSCESVVRDLYKSRDKQEFLLGAMALSYRGDDEVFEKVFRCSGEDVLAMEQERPKEPPTTEAAFEKLQEKWKRLEARDFTAFSALTRLMTTREGDRALQALGHRDPMVRLGALSLLQSLCRFVFPKTTTLGFDYSLPAEQNEAAIKAWQERWARTQVEHPYEVWRQMWRQTAGLPTPAQRKWKVLWAEHERLYALFRAADSDEAKRRYGQEVEQYRRDVLKWDENRAWLDYPGNRPRPAPPAAELRNDLGCQLYSLKWSHLQSQVDRAKDRQAWIEAEGRRWALLRETITEEAAVKEGFEYLESLERLLQDGSPEVTEAELDWSATVVTYSRAILAASTALQSALHTRAFRQFGRGPGPPYPPTPEIQSAIDALKAQYLAARAKRQAPPEAPPQP